MLREVMSGSDFDLPSLAAYLHTTPQRIARLADRGDLPGRKVGGQWRFSRPEIHHWLERRIGLSDEGELVEMEGVLQRAGGGEDAPPAVAQLLAREAIAVPLPARTRASVIREMAKLAAGTGWLWDPEKVVEAVTAREEMQPTAMEGGLALLHPRRPLPSVLDRAHVALGVTASGIPFGGARGQLTDIFLLILSTSDQEHLRILARLSRLVGDRDLLDAIRSAASARDVHQLVLEAEAEL